MSLQATAPRKKQHDNNFLLSHILFYSEVRVYVIDDQKVYGQKFRRKFSILQWHHDFLKDEENSASYIGMPIKLNSGPRIIYTRLNPIKFSVNFTMKFHYFDSVEKPPTPFL